MADNFDSNNKKLTLYKEIVIKRSLHYYYANKETICQKRKEKYKQIPPKDKKKLAEYNKQWFIKQTPERQREIKQKASLYHKNIYDNLSVNGSTSSSGI